MPSKLHASAALFALLVTACDGTIPSSPEGLRGGQRDDDARGGGGNTEAPTGSSSSSSLPPAPTSSTPSTPAPPAASGSGFRVLTPVRLLDSRDGSGLAPAAFAGSLEPGQERAISVAGLDGVLGPAATRTALALNVTVVGPEAPGYLRVYPCGTDPQVSMVNFHAGEAIGTFVIAAATENFCVRSSARTKVVIDAVGTFEKAGGLRFSALSPRRVFDSRSGAPGKTFTIPVAGLPADAEGVAAHLTITQPAAPGYATVHRCGAVPPTSSINFAAGETIGTTTLAPLDASQQLCVTASVGTHIVVDIEAVFGKSGAMGYVPRTPERILDSRSAAAKTSFELTIPNLTPGATMAAVHVTAVDAAGGAYATAHLCGAAPGNTSVVNVDLGKARTSLTFLPVDAAGRTCLTASAPLQIVADLGGLVAP